MRLVFGDRRQTFLLLSENKEYLTRYWSTRMGKNVFVLSFADCI